MLRDDEVRGLVPCPPHRGSHSAAVLRPLRFQGGLIDVSGLADRGRRADEC